VVSHVHVHVASTTQHLASWLLLIIFMFHIRPWPLILPTPWFWVSIRAQGYSVFQILPSLFAPPLSPPTIYQTEGS